MSAPVDAGRGWYAPLAPGWSADAPTPGLSSSERRGTLAEWERSTGAYVAWDRRGEVWTPDNDRAHAYGWELHHLRDYVVTSHSGGVVWLCPRALPYAGVDVGPALLAREGGR